MSDIDLTLAMAYYEHVADLTSSRVRVEGVSLRWLELPVEEIFHRFIQFREWHVSEMSMGKYVSVIAEGDDSMVGLPVFPSRVFRHSAIYVRTGEVTEPAKLRGKRIGVPEWAQTAAVYGRALLEHEWGIPLTEVDWYQAGVNQAGRIEHADLHLPPGIRLTAVPGRSLNDMLLDGSIDVVLSAHPPESSGPGIRGCPGSLPTMCKRRRSTRSGPGSSRSCMSSWCAAMWRTSIRGFPAT